MKKIIIALSILFFSINLAFIACGTKETINVTDEEKAAFQQIISDNIKIANEETEYNIIIIESSFNIWLHSIAKLEYYYSQSFL